MGLDNAGKTTLLYRWLLDEVITTIPTIGFNVETVKHPKGFAFTMWDVGGNHAQKDVAIRRTRVANLAPQGVIKFDHSIGTTFKILNSYCSSTTARIRRGSMSSWIC